jgi:hypothetical protein
MRQIAPTFNARKFEVSQPIIDFKSSETRYLPLLMRFFLTGRKTYRPGGVVIFGSQEKSLLQYLCACGTWKNSSYPKSMMSFYGRQNVHSQDMGQGHVLTPYGTTSSIWWLWRARHQATPIPMV